MKLRKKHRSAYYEGDAFSESGAVCPSLPILSMHVRTSVTFLKHSGNLSGAGMVLPIQGCAILYQPALISWSVWLTSRTVEHNGRKAWLRTRIPALWSAHMRLSLNSPNPCYSLRELGELLVPGNKNNKIKISQSLPWRLDGNDLNFT